MEKGNAYEIACLQTMLGALSGLWPKLAKVEVTGVLDEPTLEALMTFQREFCPPVTGRVDARTWHALEEAYRRAERERAQAAFQSGMPSDLTEILPGEDAPCLAQIKFMFRRLADVLDGIEDDGEDTHYGRATVRNVRRLQTAARLEPDGAVRPQTWELLARLYDMCVVRAPELSAQGE